MVARAVVVREAVTLVVGSMEVEVTVAVREAEKLSYNSTVTSITAVLSNVEGGRDGGSESDGGGLAGDGGGGEGEVSAQLGAPKVALTKAAARADLGVTRPFSVGESESVEFCLRRLSSASRSSTAVGCIGDCSHSVTVVTPSATTQSGSTSTRHGDVSSTARASSMCSTGRKPPCSREEVSWTSAHSARAGGGNAGGRYKRWKRGGVLGGTGGDGGSDGGSGIIGRAGGDAICPIEAQPEVRVPHSFGNV